MSRELKIPRSLATALAGAELSSFDPIPVPFTVDAAGFVCVDGERVSNVWTGAPLRWDPVVLMACQHCRGLRVPHRQHVVARREPAVPGGVQYHHTIAETRRAYCKRCERRMVHHAETT